MLLRINHEGYRLILAGVFLLFLMLFFQMWVLAWIAAFSTLFLAYFFRDPDRKVPSEKNIIVAPADGRVTSVREVEHYKSLKGPAKIVHIFLSPWDVHVNRVPIAGKLLSIEERGRGHKPAFMTESKLHNNQKHILLKTEKGLVEVVQIVGTLARRLKCWACVGDSLEIGQRFGMILFGSGTEVALPKDIKVVVQEGDKVVGGETIIGRY